MSNCSRGINDNRVTVPILATRIFDNVREDFDRSRFNFFAALPYDQSLITPLYAGGTGVVSGITSVSVTPRYIDGFVDVCGDLMLPGTLTYVYQGASHTAAGNLSVPFCARMKLPEDSIWPFDFTVHYSYFSDNFESTSSGIFTCLTDGVVICYITACMPVSLLYAGPIEYNSAAVRSVQTQNSFAVSPFYPSPLTQ